MPTSTLTSSQVKIRVQLEGGSALSIGNRAQKVRAKGNQDPVWVYIAESLEQVQSAVARIENALRKPPQVDRLRVAGADILDLVVGGEEGPGQLTILSGPPTFVRIGWDGTDSSGNPVDIASVSGATVTTVDPHGLTEDDIVLIEDSGSYEHNGHWVVAAVTGETTYELADPPAGFGAGGTSTLQFAGGWRRSFAIGGDGFDTAPFFAKHGVVIIGKNGAVVIQDVFESNKGFLGVQTDDPVNVTGTADNGAGLVRLTVTAHGFETGDTVMASEVGYPILVINANTFDLVGSVFSGFTPVPTVARYFAGIWTESAAFGGTSPEDAQLRVKSGALYIEDAFISIHGEYDGVESDLYIDPTRVELTSVDSTLSVSSVGLSITDLQALAADSDHFVQAVVQSFVIGLTDRDLTNARNARGYFFNGLDGIHIIVEDLAGDETFRVKPNGDTYVESLWVAGIEVINGSLDALLSTLSLSTPLPLASGGTGAATALAARTSLDVYSKAETDAAIATALAALAFLTQADADLLYSPLGHTHVGSINPAGSHTHAGAVGADGSHSHAISIT